MFTDRLFTGQRQMADLGIYQFGARFYSPKLGRFLSADSIVQQPFNPQSLNRYSYALNNPVRYTDPTGHMVASDTQGGDGCYICAYPPPPDDGGCGSDGSGGGSGSNTTTSSGGSTCDTTTNLNAEGQPCHDYTIASVVCPHELNCSEQEMNDYRLRFQYPGQFPWNPVQNRGSYTVFPFNTAPLLGILYPELAPLSIALNRVLSPYGAIRVYFNPDGSISNIAEPTHIFYEGRVDNTLTQNAAGDWIMISHGTGTNSSDFIADFNQQIGPTTFSIVDNLMLSYVEVDKLIGVLPGGD